MIEGEKMIQEMQSAREEHMKKNRKSEGVNASLIVDKNYNVKAQDLIMMNVTEKLDYLDKRQQFLNKKQVDSGVTKEVVEVLGKRRMTHHDLERLPACEVKEIF